MNQPNIIEQPSPGIAFGPSTASPEILFFHATGFNAQTYSPLFALLPKTLAGQAWDLRGHGSNPLSANPKTLTSWDRYAQDIINVLDTHPHWPSLTLSGHSLGAVIALLVAARRPTRVKRVLMIDPPLMPPRWWFYAHIPGALWMIRNLLPIAARVGKRRYRFPSKDAAFKAYQGRGAFKSWRPEFLQNYLNGGLKIHSDGDQELCCAPAWEQATFAAFRHDPWEAFRRITCPLTILIAAHHSTAAHAVKYIKRNCPKVVIDVIPDTSHFMPMEKPDLIAAYLSG
jgi:pimeloyl-ACP methyl ester carboxylesterase